MQLAFRELVQSAFERRPEWTVTTADLTLDTLDISPDALFYWGEYEQIDWEKVHAGESKTCTANMPCCVCCNGQHMYHQHFLQ